MHGHPTTIYLGAPLPMRSSNLPTDSDEQPSNVGAGPRTGPLGLAPGGVYLAASVTRGAGGLLHHPFTLTRTTPTSRRGRWRSTFCGTVPQVTPGGRYPPPRSVESGPSSAGSVTCPTRPPCRLIRILSVPSAGGTSTNQEADTGRSDRRRGAGGNRPGSNPLAASTCRGRRRYLRGGRGLALRRDQRGRRRQPGT